MGYFVYGGLDGALGMFAYGAILVPLQLICVIPFCVGPLAFFLIGLYVYNPWIFSLTGLYATWLTTVLFGSFLILGIIVSVAVSIIIAS